MNHPFIYGCGAYMFVSCILAGWMAYKRGDFFSRGLTIALMGGIFTLFFFYFAPASHAREGEEDDLRNWHVHGVFATMTHIAVILVVWAVWFAAEKV